MHEEKPFLLTVVTVALWILFFVLLVLSFRVGILPTKGPYPTLTLLEKKDITQIFPRAVIVPEVLQVPELTRVSISTPQVSRGESNFINMRASAYTLSVKSCGKSRSNPSYGITSSGTRATVGRTVGVDTKFIPLGTRLYIEFPQPYTYLNGNYVAEDTGGAISGDRIDIFWGEDRPGERIVEDNAKKFGRRPVKVYTGGR